MHNELETHADTAWQLAWQRLYSEGTSLFYDFIQDYALETRFAHLPTPAEIARQYPNTNGWATGMEDSTINGGVMLTVACDRYAVTGESSMRDAASRLFDGLVRCGTQSRRPGFVLRSVSPFDCASYYIETSRDQLTHYAHGLWRFFHSALCAQGQRDTIRRLLTELCTLMEQTIVPERDYHVGTETGEPGLVDKMWAAQAHEMGRLPMIYAAGWDVTGERHWWDCYRQCAPEAARQAGKLKPQSYDKAYPLFQHQISLELLAAVETEDRELQSRWRSLMRHTAEGAAAYCHRIDNYTPCDATSLNMDWRQWNLRDGFEGAGYQVPAWPAGFMDSEFGPLRETGEALLIQLMGRDNTLSARHQHILRRALVEPTWDLAFTYGMLYPQAAYWRAARGELA